MSRLTAGFEVEFIVILRHVKISIISLAEFIVILRHVKISILSRASISKVERLLATPTASQELRSFDVWGATASQSLG